MRTNILLLTLLAVAIPGAVRAQTFPQIPDSERILSQLEVKNFWVNRMPEPQEPGRLARGYDHLIVQYHQQVGERHRLIQAIRAGVHDRLAEVVKLRHNIRAYQLQGEELKAAPLKAELAKIEAVVQQEEDERANADRLERLIAATERLAAAIENNGGNLPADAEQMVAEIIPFERDRDDRRDLFTHLREEIALCQQPIIVHRRLGRSVAPAIDHRHGGTTSHIVPSTGGTRIRPSAPTGGSPAILPHPRPTTIMPRQPQVRPVPAPRQPQVRPAR